MRAALLLVAALVAAGCLSGEPEPRDPADERTPSRPAFDPRAERPSPEDRTDGGESGRASLATAPGLVPGQWWNIRVTSPLLPAPVEWTRVVAGVEGEDYLIGQPRDTWSTEGILLHVPGLGEVSRRDLSFEAHDVRFHPFSFPLTDGKEWDTAFEGLPVTARTTVLADGTAEIWYCCGRNISALYDPAMGDFVRFEVEGLLTYEVLDHGLDWEGVVTVPHGHDLVFRHGRIAGVLSVDQEPGPPVEDVVLSDDYQRISFFQLAGPLDLAPPAPLAGAFIERVTAPDGTVYETARLPHEGPGFTTNTFESTNVGGTWHFEHVAPGPGIAFTEGIAYHVFDVEVPSGRLLGDHSEHVT